MSRMQSEYLDADPAGRSVAADVLVREEPEDEEDEEDDGKEEDDEDKENDEGYSELYGTPRAAEASSNPHLARSCFKKFTGVAVGEERACSKIQH